MKNYSKPITESIDVRSVDFFMALAGSGEHGIVGGAPARRFAPDQQW